MLVRARNGHQAPPRRAAASVRIVAAPMIAARVISVRRRRNRPADAGRRNHRRDVGRWSGPGTPSGRWEVSR
ncbi:hypothetical protein ACFFMN_31940 [Planobispora siamensis]|nr:hypothetical protein [Planobispora siamensis]